MFYKSNSILIGFDANAFNADINNFNFLNLVQSFSFDVNLKNSNQKFLGSSETIRDQYTTPEVNFNLSYIQRVDFFNEFAFGFNIYSKESSKANIAKKFEKGFLNQNVFVLLDPNNEDLISKLSNIENHEIDLKVISFGRVFLNSYSVNYSIGALPIVSASFSSFNTSTSNIESRNLLKDGDTSILSHGFRNWQDSFYEIPLFKGKDLVSNLNENIDETIVYHMRNFSIDTDYASDSLVAPNLNFKTLLDGVIQSLDFSLDFNRNKFYFFEKEFSDSNFIYPIKGSLKINGISSDLTNGNLKNIFEKNKFFSVKLSLGKNEQDKDFYELILEKISINSFSFSVDINGMLNYTLDCYFEVGENSGAFIRQVNKVYNSKLKVDSNFLVSEDGESISVFPESAFKQLPQITQNLPSVFTIPNSCSTKQYLTICACDPDSDPLTYYWYCNNKLIPNKTGTSLDFQNATCTTMGFYNVVVKNCNLQTIKSSTAAVLVSGNPLILSNSFCSKFKSGVDIDLFADALADGDVCYFWYKGTGILQNSGKNFKICCFSNEQTGGYYFKAANSGYESFSDIYCFSIASSPLALSNPFSLQNTGTITESCSYFCLNISGQNTCNFNWRKNGKIIFDTLPSFPIKYSGAETSGLYINKPDYLDNGFYDVVLSNDEDSIISNGFQLDVKTKPIFSNTGLTCLNVAFGSFLCLTSDLINEDANTSYCWIYNNQIVKSGSENFYCSKIATNLNEGSYGLIANNCYGFARKEYLVNINSSPILSFTSSLECLAPLYSDVCFFSCVIGSEPITYKWFFSPNCVNFYELSLGKDPVKELCIDSVLANNMGWYYLQATNENGSVCTPLFNLCVESFALPDLRPTISAASPSPSYKVEVINVCSIDTVEQKIISTSQCCFQVLQSLLNSTFPVFSDTPPSLISSSSIATSIASPEIIGTSSNAGSTTPTTTTSDAQTSLPITSTPSSQTVSGPTTDTNLNNVTISNQSNSQTTVSTNSSNGTTSAQTTNQTNNTSSTTTINIGGITSSIQPLNFGNIGPAEGDVIKVCNKDIFEVSYSYTADNPCIIFSQNNAPIYRSLNAEVQVSSPFVRTDKRQFFYKKEDVCLADAGTYNICVRNKDSSISRSVKLEVLPSQPEITCIYLNSRDCVIDFYTFVSRNYFFQACTNANDLCDKDRISYCWVKKDGESEVLKSNQNYFNLSNIKSCDSGCYIFCVLNERTFETDCCGFVLNTVEGPYFTSNPENVIIDFGDWTTKFPTFSASSLGTKPICYTWQYCLENQAIENLNTSYFNCSNSCNLANSDNCSKSEIVGTSGIFYTLNGVINSSSVTDEQKKCKWYFRVCASSPYGSNVSSWASLCFSSNPARVTSLSTIPSSSLQVVCRNCTLKINAFVEGPTPICWFVKGVYFRTSDNSLCAVKVVENGVTVDTEDSCVSVHPSFSLNNVSKEQLLSNGAIYYDDVCTSGKFRYFCSNSNVFDIDVPLEYACGRIFGTRFLQNPLSAIFYIGVKNKYNAGWCCSVSFCPNTTSQYCCTTENIQTWAKSNLDQSSIYAIACNCNSISLKEGASTKTYFDVDCNTKKYFCFEPDFTGNYCTFNLFASSNLNETFEGCASRLVGEVNCCCISLAPIFNRNCLLLMKFVAKNPKCTFYSLSNYFCRLVAGEDFLYRRSIDTTSYGWLGAEPRVRFRTIECSEKPIFLCGNSCAPHIYTCCTLWQCVVIPQSIDDYIGCWAKYDSATSSWIDIPDSNQDPYKLESTYLNSGCYRRVLKHRHALDPNCCWPIDNDRIKSVASGLIMAVDIAEKIDMCIQYGQNDNNLFFYNSEIYFTGCGSAGISKHCWSYFVGNLTELSIPTYIGCYDVQYSGGRYLTTGKLNLASLNFQTSNLLNIIVKACSNTIINELEQCITRISEIPIINTIRLDGIKVQETPLYDVAIASTYTACLDKINVILKERGIGQIPTSVSALYASEGTQEFTRQNSLLQNQINLKAKFPDGNVKLIFGLENVNVSDNTQGITEYGWFVKDSSNGFKANPKSFIVDIDLSKNSFYCMYPCWVHFGKTYTGNHVCYTTDSKLSIFNYFSVGSNSKSYPSLNAGGEVISENGLFWGFSFVVGNLNNLYNIKFDKVPLGLPQNDIAFICNSYEQTFPNRLDIQDRVAAPFTPYFFKFENVSKLHQGDYSLLIKEYCKISDNKFNCSCYEVVNNISVASNLLLCPASDDQLRNIEYYIDKVKKLANIDINSTNKTCSTLVEEGNLCLVFRANGVRNFNNPISGAVFFCKGASTGLIPESYFAYDKICCEFPATISEPVRFIATIRPECIKYDCFNNICLFPYVKSTLSNVICTGKSYVHICCISEKIEDINISLYKKTTATTDVSTSIKYYYPNSNFQYETSFAVFSLREALEPPKPQYTLYTLAYETEQKISYSKTAGTTYEPVLKSYEDASHVSFYEFNDEYRLSGDFSYSDASTINDLTFQWFCQCMIGISEPVAIPKATSRWLDLPAYNLTCLNKNYFLCICNTKFPNSIGKTGITCCLSISGVNNVDIVVYKGSEINIGSKAEPRYVKEPFDSTKKENFIEGSLGYFYLSFESLAGTPLSAVKNTCLYVDSGSISQPSTSCFDITSYLKNAEGLQDQKDICAYIICCCNLYDKYKKLLASNGQTWLFAENSYLRRRTLNCYWTECVPVYNQTKVWKWTKIPYTPAKLTPKDDEKCFFLNAFIPTSQDVDSPKVHIRKPITQVSVYTQLKYVNQDLKEVTNGQFILQTAPLQNFTLGQDHNSYYAANSALCFLNMSTGFSNCACLLYRIMACNETQNIDFCLCSCYFSHEYAAGKLTKITPKSRLIKVNNEDDPISLTKIVNENDPTIVCAMVKFKNISGANYSNPSKEIVDIYSGSHCLIAFNCCFQDVSKLTSTAFKTVPILRPLFEPLTCQGNGFTHTFKDLIINSYSPSFIGDILLTNDVNPNHTDYNCIPNTMFLTCNQCVNLCFNICAAKEISTCTPLTCRWVVCYQTDKNKIYSGIVSSATSNAYLVKYPPQGLAAADYVVGPVKYCACVSNSFTQSESSPVCIFYRCDKIKLCCTQIAYPTGNSHTNPPYENIQCVNSNPCQIISVNKGQLVCLRTCIYTGFTPYTFWLYSGVDKLQPGVSTTTKFTATTSTSSLTSSVTCIIDTSLFSSNETCISLTGYNAHYAYGVFNKDPNSVFGNQNLLIINLKTDPAFLKPLQNFCNVLYGCCLHLCACDAVFPIFTNKENNNSTCCFIWRSGCGLTSSNIIAQGNLCTGLVINPFNCVDMPTNCTYSVTYELCWTGLNNTIDCRSVTRYFCLCEGIASYGINNVPTWVQKNAVAGNCNSCIWVLAGNKNSIPSSCNMFLLPGTYEIFAWGGGGGGSVRSILDSTTFAGGGAGGFVSGRFCVSAESKCLCIASLIGVGGEWGGYSSKKYTEPYTVGGFNLTRDRFTADPIRPTPLQSDSFHCIQLIGTASSTTKQCFSDILCSRRGMSGPIETDGYPSVRSDFLLNTYLKSAEALTIQDQYKNFLKGKRFYYHPCQIVSLRGTAVYKDCATVLSSVSKSVESNTISLGAVNVLPLNTSNLASSIINPLSAVAPLGTLSNSTVKAGPLLQGQTRESLGILDLNTFASVKTPAVNSPVASPAKPVLLEKYTENSYLLFDKKIEDDNALITSIFNEDVNSNINLINIRKDNFAIAACLGTKTSPCAWSFQLSSSDLTKYQSLVIKDQTSACFVKCGISYLFFYPEPKCFNDYADLFRPRTNFRVAGGAGGGATAVVLAIPNKCVSGILVAGGGGGAGGAVSVKPVCNNSCFTSTPGKSGPAFTVNWTNSLICGLYAGGESESCFNGGGGWSSSICSTATAPLFEGYGGHGGCTCVSGSVANTATNFFCAVEKCAWNCGRNDNSNATIASYLCFYTGSSQMAINNIPQEIQLKGGIPSNCISSSGNMYNYFRELIAFGGAGANNGYDGGIIIVKL